jgi:hypothetical protein
MLRRTLQFCLIVVVIVTLVISGILYSSTEDQKDSADPFETHWNTVLDGTQRSEVVALLGAPTDACTGEQVGDDFISPQTVSVLTWKRGATEYKAEFNARDELIYRRPWAKRSGSRPVGEPPWLERLIQRFIQ